MSDSQLREFCVFFVEPILPIQARVVCLLESPKSPKGALFTGDKKSRKFLFKSGKILNWPWRAHFWAHHILSYHFGNLWTSTRRWLKGNWPKVARSITYWPFFENLFCSRNFWFPTFGILMFLMKSHYFKELLGILEKNLWNGPQKWVFWEFFF